ncbi:acetyl/propionyl/methylcrotonyl-CoA carboxylase subunit alpha [Granulosicoccus sp.]|nr:acetyl/propionyl/methylcrotonyl-CoA carboxylase subunit alpha [Granulosicoccus sp.]MDB4222523.1 acetyl/propionyl/methylcrotonyl-CoA carboxylase subunit alpha [Granulosicoccus sp.]
MFSKILIANRGEIACRVIATCKKMGIKTVAVYSDADANAKHVAMADEAVRLGPPPVAQSYLLGDNIIAAAVKTGAQAIHPGYGFLSENPSFATAVEAAGVKFIGPPASAISAMGLKDAAKARMIEAGVPVVPGYHEENQDPEFLAVEAEKIGYPVMIKARAGGGGKGMRLVEKAEDFLAALESAKREADASFADPACLIEKYITSPRHIEVQVFTDMHGNGIHLYERDCSLQRRHQKVIEEAPAPGMSPQLREEMGSAAVRAAQAVGYHNAGTVEFIVDGAKYPEPGCFWFMEMNTRLQVEHPVSEAITGLDFVELQLRVASGEPLPVSQSDLKLNGHSFEARLYAEDVPKGFLPATGTLDRLIFPQHKTFENAVIRIDSGIRQRDTITPFYDPMIAKVIVHGSDRDAALAALRQVLSETLVVGSVTNLQFLAALARHPGFNRGDVDTGLIARDLDSLTSSPEITDEVKLLASVLALNLAPDTSTKAENSDPWAHYCGWRHWGVESRIVTMKVNDDTLQQRIRIEAAGKYTLDNEVSVFDITAIGNYSYIISKDGEKHTLRGVKTGNNVTVISDATSFSFELPDPLASADSLEDNANTVVAPMPGSVIWLSIKSGAKVKKGDPLLTLEAMKMEHVLIAPRDGTVAELLVSEGDQVQDGALLVVLAEES